MTRQALPLFCAAVAWMLLIHPCLAQEVEQQGDGPKTGSFSTSFSERAPLSDLDSQAARMRWPRAQITPDYNIAEESFEVYVPEAYDGSEAYGLLVWVSPSPSGSMPGHWRDVMDTHKLIWIGANKSGNPEKTWRRMGMALDAADNMTKQYNIDEHRIYLGGLSGGGRISSHMGIVYSDIFNGAFMMVGCDFYKSIRLPSKPEQVWQARFAAPRGGQLNKARKENRYVFLTGEVDYSREQTAEIYRQGYLREQFWYADYLEVPGMGHTYPPAEWFGRGIELLDAPIAAGLIGDRKGDVKPYEYRTQRGQEALDAAARLLDEDLLAGYEELEIIAIKYVPTPPATEARKMLRAIRNDSEKRAIVEEGKKKKQAEQLLRNGQAYIAAGMWTAAKFDLKLLIKRYPDAPEAERAKDLLRDMPTPADAARTP